MLIQRLLAAIVLIPLVIICLFYLPLSAYVGVIILICALAVWEWSQFLHIKLSKNRLVFTALFTVFIALIYVISDITGTRLIVSKFILLLSLVWWLFALLLVISYPNSIKVWQNSFTKTLFACFTVIPFFIGMIQLREIDYHFDSYQGAFWLLYVLVLVWATDSGAYFAGRAFGKHKLAPKVSPGKTIEGLVGGVILSLFISMIVYSCHLFDVSFYSLILSSIFAIFVSVLGDLTESMFKREANIKDSGHLIPGHGGILDRIDSLTAAIPVFAAILFYF